MRIFFERYLNFWIISRIVITIPILISTLILLGEGNLEAMPLLVNLIGLLEGILLSIVIITGFIPNTDAKALRQITGAILIVFGIALFVTLLFVPKGSQSEIFFLGYPFAVWMILMGLFDFLQIKKKKTEPYTKL